jgi:hypothetical protein
MHCSTFIFTQRREGGRPDHVERMNMYHVIVVQVPLVHFLHLLAPKMQVDNDTVVT